MKNVFITVIFVFMLVLCQSCLAQQQVINFDLEVNESANSAEVKLVFSNTPKLTKSQITILVNKVNQIDGVTVNQYLASSSILFPKKQVIKGQSFIYVQANNKAGSYTTVAEMIAKIIRDLALPNAKVSQFMPRPDRSGL